MNIEQIRLQNYRALWSRFSRDEAARGGLGRGQLSRFGALVGASPRYLSHVGNGRKNIGRQLARQFEAAFLLPNGWMDVNHVPDTGRRERMLGLIVKVYDLIPTETEAKIIELLTAQLIRNCKPPGVQS